MKLGLVDSGLEGEYISFRFVEISKVFAHFSLEQNQLTTFIYQHQLVTTSTHMRFVGLVSRSSVRDQSKNPYPLKKLHNSKSNYWGQGTRGLDGCLIGNYAISQWVWVLDFPHDPWEFGQSVLGIHTISNTQVLTDFNTGHDTIPD